MEELAEDDDKGWSVSLTLFEINKRDIFIFFFHGHLLGKNPDVVHLFQLMPLNKAKSSMIMIKTSPFWVH